MACCPNCGGEAVLGNDVASVCAECGQATLLGMSVPVASVVAAAVLVVLVCSIVHIIQRWRALPLAAMPA